MEKANRILNNSLYRKWLDKNNKCEENRMFCKHNIEHFLDMARISYILCLEKRVIINKDIIYSVALLHDIGRWKEYEEGISHEIASYELSKEILKQCEFTDEEKKIILSGILNHRNKNAIGIDKIFYESDKLSRSCFKCDTEKQCKWAKEKKNMIIKY
ncbi:MAG: HD domain-containing protein, partial [Sarcina sp.]